MDKLILNTSFGDISQDERNIFCEKINDMLKNDISQEELINAINSSILKVKEYHPLRHSEGYNLYQYNIYRIRDVLSNISNTSFTSPIINWIRSIIESGWTAANADFLLEVINLIPAEYFSNMTQNDLQEHLQIFHITDFAISEFDDPDNQNYVRDMQNRFTKSFFIDRIESTLVDSSKDIYTEFLKVLYLKCWSKHEKSIDVYSRMISSINRKFSDTYLQSPDIFIKHFEEITAKIIDEDIPTKQGQVEVISFYSHNYSLIRKSKEIAEKIMEKWISALIDIFNLERKWTNPIISTFALEIRMIDRSFEKTAFNNSGHLLSGAINVLMVLVDRFPRSSTDKDDVDYKSNLDMSNEIIKSLTTKFFQYTIKSWEHFESVIPVLLKLVALNESDTIDHFTHFFRDIEKPIQGYFKAKPDLIIPFINQFIDVAMFVGETEDVSVEFPFSKELRRLRDPYDVIKDLGKKSRAFESTTVQDVLQKGLVKMLNKYSLSSSTFITNFSEFMVGKNYSEEDMLVTFQSMNKAMSKDLFHIYNPFNFNIGRLYGELIETVVKSLSKYLSCVEEISKTPKILLNFDLQLDRDGEIRDTPSCMILMGIFSKFLMNKAESKIILCFYPLLIDVVDKADESNGFYSSWISYLCSCPLTMTEPGILIPFIGRLISLGKKMLNTDLQSNMSMLLMSLKAMCISDPSSLLPYIDVLDNFFDNLQSDTASISFIIQLLALVYNEFPEKVDESLVMKISEKLNDDLGTAYQVVAFISVIIKGKSHVLDKKINEFLVCLKNFKSSIASPLLAVLTALLENDLSLGEIMFESIVQNIEENMEDVIFLTALLNGLRSMGILRHELLVERRMKIELWQQAKPVHHDICQHLLDVIADRSLATLDADLSDQKKIVEAVDSRLLVNETKVENVVKEVEDHNVALIDVHQKVSDTNTRVSEIEKDIEHLVEEVQEIDMKNVSSAPKWAREVSKLMNPESDNDWRLLASRLGYSNDDVRAWSTNSDPCMSLLSDWFAVRRHIEATKSILEQLIEMNLTDVAKIVENALTAAEAVISDEDPVEFVEPPLVFLSYQWAVQEEVKLLRCHLQKAGYRCWMDIGQMGGGDKLYEAIDRGIRGAKVFIACVTEKYSQSPNCKRELNLSISLNKAVIPLQMEQMSWPPPGTMGPLLTEYIFIRMFGKPGGKLVEGTFWPKERFQELLLQIRYSCAPEYDTIDEEYRDWWQPAEEKLNYVPREKNDENKNETSKADESKAAGESPDIFLSYQWGKQEQVKKLYSFLRNRGFSCWMDIYEMGGGDSLYDKIDRGLRGCKLMISCLTPSYTESPNCRREVSLCDNLKRPLIPIILEQMTWPPEGPMSMVFTQLLYVSFVDSVDEQQSWTGPSTDELLGKICQVIPNNSPAQLSPGVDAKIVRLPSIDNPTSATSSADVRKGKGSVVLMNKAIHLRSTNDKNPLKYAISKSRTCALS